MAAVPELTYFDGRGLGEIVRITLAAAGIQYNEIDLTTREQFLSLHPDLLFKQVPLLRIDGLKIVQSNAIVRYVARKGKLLGSTDIEIVLVDQLYDGVRDCYMNFAALGGFVPDDVKQLETCKEKLKKYLPIFDKVLADNGSGYLVGSGLTIADLALFELLAATMDFCGKDNFHEYANLVTFYASITSLPRIQKYLEIRKPVNTPAYVELVKKILAW